MEKELDSFLGDLNEQPDAEIFGTKEDAIDGFGEAAEENTEDEVTEEKPEPFHKNPKIKRFIEKEISKALGSRETQAERPSTPEEADRLTDALVRIIGNDTPEKELAIRDLKNALRDEARNESRAERTAREDEARRAQAEARESLDSSLEQIEETYGVDITSDTAAARKTRADFIGFVQKIAPKNDDGEITEYPDFVSTFEVYSELAKTRQQAPSNARAKEIASRSMARSTDTTASKPAGRVTWDTVNRIFEN